MNIQKIKNIKAFIRALQVNQLDIVTDIILGDTDITLKQLRIGDHTEYRRKIAFLSRVLYNTSGNSISDYLNVSKGQVSEYIYSAFQRCQKDQEYLLEIREIIKKVVQHHTALFNQIL